MPPTPSHPATLVVASRGIENLPAKGAGSNSVSIAALPCVPPSTPDLAQSFDRGWNALCAPMRLEAPTKGKGRALASDGLRASLWAAGWRHIRGGSEAQMRGGRSPARLGPCAIVRSALVPGRGAGRRWRGPPRPRGRARRGVQGSPGGCPATRLPAAWKHGPWSRGTPAPPAGRTPRGAGRRPRCDPFPPPAPC
jgi:hypothetical protein